MKRTLSETQTNLDSNTNKRRNLSGETMKNETKNEEIKEELKSEKKETRKMKFEVKEEEIGSKVLDLEVEIKDLSELDADIEKLLTAFYNKTKSFQKSEREEFIFWMELKEGKIDVMKNAEDLQKRHRQILSYVEQVIILSSSFVDNVV